MIRRPPKSTLFPYTRSSDLIAQASGDFGRFSHRLLIGNFGDGSIHRRSCRRSEEHTSELQSQSNLVCRLLLEKKNKTISDSTRHSLSFTAKVCATIIR